MKTFGLTALFLLVTLCAWTPVFASDPTDPNTLLEAIHANAPPVQTMPQQVGAQQVAQTADYAAYRIEEEKSRRLLIVTLIGAAIISLVIVLWFLRLTGTANSGAIVTGSGLVLVIYATVIVVNIARADQQLTAAMGILGAIAGYLFGTATGGAAERPAKRLPAE